MTFTNGAGRCWRTEPRPTDRREPVEGEEAGGELLAAPSRVVVVAVFGLSAEGVASNALQVRRKGSE
jgi:hypothetical protein